MALPTKRKVKNPAGNRGASSTNSQNASPTYKSMMEGLGNNVVKKIISVSEYIVNFKILRFIKIFMYHLLFFYIGPFVVPIIVILDNKDLACNMGFWLPTKMLPSLII